MEAYRKASLASACSRLSVASILLLLALTPSVLGTTSTTSDSPRNIVLFYDDYPTRGDPEFQVVRSVAMPLVAYVDRDGRPVDWLFDSFVFYSLWLYYTKNPTQTYIDSWIEYLFDGKQIANLDATVAEAKAKLGQPDYRLKVFLTIPVASNEMRASSILKNVDELLRRWDRLGPQNLKLVGFYWGFSESLTSVKGVEGMIPEIASQIHSKGFKLLIIPYRGAGGFERMHSLGFDYVTVQSNYAWAQDDLSRFAQVNDLIKQGHVDGPELELPVTDPLQCCSGDWRTNLQTSLEQGSQFGWNRATVQTYYHGSDISLLARRSDPSYRAAYEAIYQYIFAGLTA